MSLVLADARALPLVDSCVQCVVTSPPYWGLRDYGQPGQLGLEATPAAYVAALVAVFREVRRVLKPDGVVWLNLGDAYVHGIPSGGCVFQNGRTDGRLSHLSDRARGREKLSTRADGLKTKDLVGIPWRVAFALQADGWYLRADVIWSKPNPMPESVTDRPTKAHEYVFLLSKAARYYYDAAAIQERAIPQVRTSVIGYVRPKDPFLSGSYPNDKRRSNPSSRLDDPTGSTRNVRSVWTINPQPYSGAHFATFPEQLVERCILAGSKTGDRILDPFVGSGTVARVAISLGRQAVGCDLSPAYLTLAKERCQVTRGLPFSFEDETVTAEMVTPPDTLRDGLESSSNGANQSHVVSSLFPKDSDQVGIFPSESHGSPGAAGASVYLLRDIPKERPKSRKTPNGKSPTWDQTTKEGRS